MTPEEIMEKVGDNLSVRRVFGEPIERDGTVVIPVAIVAGGGGVGSGTSEAGDGMGGGFGGLTRGIGAYTIRNGEVRFVPAVDIVALAGIGLMCLRVLVSVLRRHRRRGVPAGNSAGASRRSCCGRGSPPA
ncbi:MAG: hypothetical protein QG622_1416 [Actinomycetota bacterium]|nr:hypothetical protein [Actinomycetota bacterium]